MFVSISGWETKGLRCPDMNVSFEKTALKNQINLVLMPNGTGKSTIIELISTALTGNTLNSENISSFKGNDNLEDVGHFILHLKLSQEKDRVKSITFQLNFDFISNEINFFTKQDDTVGLEQGWHAPVALQPFLNNKCVEVFVFKGDKVAHLLNKERNDAELAIKAFFGISKIEDLNSSIEDDFQSRKKTGPQTSQAETQRKNVLFRWYERLKELEEQKLNVEKYLETIEKEHEQKKQRYEAIISGQKSNQVKLTELTSKKNKAISEMSSASIKMMSAIRNPMFISDKIQNKLLNLKQNLDKMKLPGTSIEFFHELAKQPKCICDRDIDKNAEKSILLNASTYLSDDHILIVNGIKKDIQTYIDKSNDQKDENLLDALKNASENFIQTNQLLMRHLNKIKDDATQDEKVVLDDWEMLTANIAKARQDLDGLLADDISERTASSGPESACNSVIVAKKVIRLREEELAEISNNKEDFYLKEKLKNIIDNTITKSLDFISDELKNKSNEKLKKILVRGTRLEILSINKSLQIGYEGISQKDASGGQSVSIAYSFATSILERSGIQFPLIVDHPVTALQTSARRGLGDNLAKICHQFIGFVIDTEKEGFLPALRESSKNLNLITIFRPIEGNIPYLQKLPKDSKLSVKTSNGVICSDYQFFEDFTDLNLAEGEKSVL